MKTPPGSALADAQGMIADLRRQLSERAAERDEALAREAANAEVLRVINSSSSDLAPVFDTILDKALTLCDAAFGSLRGFDGGGFPPLAVRGLATPGSMMPEPGSALQLILDGEDVVHIPDLIDTDGYRFGLGGRVALVNNTGARTALWVALRKDRSVVGIFVIYRREVRPFTDKQVALLQTFAAQAVLAMENARLITETRENLERQTATADILRAIAAAPGEVEGTLQKIGETTARLFGASGVTIRIAEGDRYALTIHVGHGAAELSMAVSDPTAALDPVLPHSLPGTVIRENRQIHLPDLDNLPPQTADWPGTRVLRAAGARTLVGTPLRREGRAIGSLNAWRDQFQPFDTGELQLLQSFADQAAIAIENARLLGELRQSTAEVAELNRGLEARVAEQVEELGRIGRLKRFLAPQLAEMIVSQGDEQILESHRREIVVVFCDLRGYTAFTETAEPEEVLDFLREYHGALGPLVSQFEGTLDQFSGDGIMVFFNDPVPCADPAERAVNMAVAMRSAASTLIVDWRERGRDLGFGAGIAQGYATLGQIGFSERSGYTAIGTVCNVAARLCAEAKDGQILLSQRVNVTLKGSVATEQVGALALKGLSQPVVAYNVPLASTQPALRVIDGGGPQSV